jgi:hypothetical protein
MADGHGTAFRLLPCERVGFHLEPRYAKMEAFPWRLREDSTQIFKA